MHTYAPPARPKKRTRLRNAASAHYTYICIQPAAATPANKTPTTRVTYAHTRGALCKKRLETREKKAAFITSLCLAARPKTTRRGLTQAGPPVKTKNEHQHPTSDRTLSRCCCCFQKFKRLPRTRALQFLHPASLLPLSPSPTPMTIISHMHAAASLRNRRYTRCRKKKKKK